MILFRGYEDIESVFLQAGKDSDWLSLREYEDLLEEVRHLTFECERRHGTHGMIFLSNLAEGGELMIQWPQLTYSACTNEF